MKIKFIVYNKSTDAATVVIATVVIASRRLRDQNKVDHLLIPGGEAIYRTHIYV